MMEIRSVQQAIQDEVNSLDPPDAAPSPESIEAAQSKILQAIRERQFPISGQFFVISSDGRVLYHPAIPEGVSADRHFPAKA